VVQTPSLKNRWVVGELGLLLGSSESVLASELERRDF